MLKISNREVIDVVRYSDTKAIIVEKKPNLDFSSYGLKYFILNFDTGEKEMVTKDAYLLKKFGTKRQEISNALGNFALCDARILPNRQVLVIYPTGQTGLFDRDGRLIRDGLLTYNDSEVSCIADDGEYFWSVCQKENCVIRYLNDGAKVDLRIGSKDAKTFVMPHFVSADSSFVYVCCNHSKVRKIDKKDFSVSDIPKEYINLTGYYKFGEYAIVTTLDGAYCDKD